MVLFFTLPIGDVGCIRTNIKFFSPYLRHHLHSEVTKMQKGKALPVTGREGP
jgi:hypothetical protein